MTANSSASYRLDDLRRLVTSLATQAGLTSTRASAFATHLLWFDAIGAFSHGIASLPAWLARIESREIDPVALGRVTMEKAGTAVFDAARGLPPLALEAAATIAAEKAREIGIGLVRIKNLGPAGPTAPIVSGLAAGPFAVAITGPGPSLAIAIPYPENLPVIFDSALGHRKPDEALGDLGPLVGIMAGPNDWVVLVSSIAATESLAGFHERVSASSVAGPGQGGPLWPEGLEASRRQARERGISLLDEATDSLRTLADRWNVPWPAARELG